jgi:apolipoprotein N-acyltransferase
LSSIPEAQAPAATPVAWHRRPAIELATMAALGALQTAAFVAGDLWPLQLVAIALLAWRVGVAAPRHAAALGFAFATAWIGAATWWMFVSMHRYGGLAAPLAALAVLALAAFLALYFGAAMAAVARWRPRSPARSASPKRTSRRGSAARC